MRIRKLKLAVTLIAIAAVIAVAVTSFVRAGEEKGENNEREQAASTAPPIA